MEKINQKKILNLRLYKVLRKMGVSRDKVSLKADLFNDLFFDSYDMNIFLFYLEAKFDIQIKDEEISQITTIGHTLHFIEEKLDVA
jgi:acyl carrier protein